MQGVYAIIDVETLISRDIDPLCFAAAICDAQPAALQVRDKRHAARDTLALLRAARPLASESGVALFANDRPDLAALAGCDGVHLGQDDLSVSDARKVMRAIAGRDMMVGMSVHDAAELEIALSQVPDYLAFGAVFGTGSKSRPTPTLGVEGLEELARAARAATTAPLVAIGSIDATRAPLLTMVDAVAAIAALLVERGDPYAGARERTEALTRAFAMSRR
jgi:thiamine-phosphate pyrophosphorylase